MQRPLKFGVESFMSFFRPSTLFFSPIASSSVLPYLFQVPFSCFKFYQLIPCYDLCNVRAIVFGCTFILRMTHLLAQTSTRQNVIIATAVLNGHSQPVSVIRHNTYLVFVTVSWAGHGMPVAVVTEQPNIAAPLPVV